MGVVNQHEMEVVLKFPQSRQNESFLLLQFDSLYIRNCYITLNLLTVCMSVYTYVILLH